MSLTRHETDVDQLAAPAEDGGVLVWPSGERIVKMVEENSRTREARALRVAGGAAALPGPLPIMSGHQPEMMHPGVWIKLVAASRLARVTDRKALFVCVDHDLTNGIPLHLPAREDGRWRTRNLPLGSMGVHTFEQEPLRASGEWARLLNDLGVGQADSAWRIFAEEFLAGRGDGVVGDYIERWACGINALLTACGEAPMSMLRVSEMFLPPAPTLENHSHAFVASILQDARRFAESYNRSLLEYREERRIRGDAHPIPNLLVSEDRIELPFWLSQASGPRSRLQVSFGPGGVLEVFAGEIRVCTIGTGRLNLDPVAALSAALGSWRIRPRALALTMYLRLFHCDLFIHGIGGAKYDVITDSIIRDFFRVEPPGYACVSATARLALDAAAQSAVVEGVAAARHRLRSARFNPQRLISPSNATGEVAIALAEREASISEARNLREFAPNDHAARRGAFQRIRNANQRIASLCPRLVEDAELAVDVALHRAEDRVVMQSREWFTGLYTLEQLRALCARLPW